MVAHRRAVISRILEAAVAGSEVTDLQGLSVPEVALISGHRDYRMLFRYTHLRAEDIVEKLG